MSNSKEESMGMKIVKSVDKVIAAASIGYGVYLLSNTGSFLGDSFLSSPAIWMVCGSFSLFLSFLNLPQRLQNKMRKSMIVSR